MSVFRGFPPDLFTFFEELENDNSNDSAPPSTTSRAAGHSKNSSICWPLDRSRSPRASNRP